MKRNVLMYKAESILGTNIPLKFSKGQGRNDKCACGSKLKHKNCCGKKKMLMLQHKMENANG